jgi:hypothetical protein
MGVGPGGICGQARAEGGGGRGLFHRVGKLESVTGYHTGQCVILHDM